MCEAEYGRAPKHDAIPQPQTKDSRLSLALHGRKSGLTMTVLRCSGRYHIAGTSSLYSRQEGFEAPPKLTITKPSRPSERMAATCSLGDRQTQVLQCFPSNSPYRPCRISTTQYPIFSSLALEAHLPRVSSGRADSQYDLSLQFHEMHSNMENLSRC